MSVGLLGSCLEPQSHIHTALDDLESFLWVLIWGIVHASKDIHGAKAANRGIQLMLDAWSGDVSYNLSKHAIAERSWKDMVFGGLIKEWLNIFNRASNKTWKLLMHMRMIPLNNQEGSDWRRACDRLESYCIETYEAVLKSGFEHLEDIRDYSNWTEVVAANLQEEF
jgi:hypothetical protein